MKLSWPPSLNIPGLQRRTPPAPPRTRARPLQATYAPAAPSPPPSSPPPLPPPRPPPSTPHSTLPIGGSHISRVKPGDPLMTIAAQNRITAAHLATPNGIKESTPIRVAPVLN